MMNDLLERLFEAGRRKTVVGYRGRRDEAENGHGVTGTEGNGIYIADSPRLAEFFGDVWKVEYVPPRHPLIVDDEPLYLLHEMDELFDPIADDDTDWAKANKIATKRSGVTDQHWDPEKVAAELTTVIKEMGYDGVKVVSGGEGWVVLFDPKAVVHQEPFDIGERIREDEDVHARRNRERREEQERDVKYYNAKNVLGAAEDDEFRVEIHNNHRKFTIRKADPSHPVPGGWWMGFWDPDLQEVLGIDQENYDRMSRQEQAEADAKVQLKKYAHEQYWDEYAEFYHQREYELHGRAGSWVDRNKYWKKKLGESINEVRFLEPRGGSKGGEAGDYFYHTTTLYALYDIARSELSVGRPEDSGVWTDEPQMSWSDGSDEERSYWSDSEAGTVDFSRPQAVVLRVAKKDVPEMKEERGTGDFYMTKPVDSDLLEVLTDKGWVKLSALNQG